MIGPITLEAAVIAAVCYLALQEQQTPSPAQLMFLLVAGYLLVGKAWKYLKDLRLERGPLEHDEAVAELKKWWNAQQP